MIDLGTWAGEQYSVAGGPIDDHEHPQDREQSLPGETINGSERRKLLH